MTSQINAEFKKLLSVRSTFIVSLAIVLFTGLLMFAMNAKTYEPTKAPTSASASQAAADSKQQAANAPSQPPPAPKLTSNLPPNQLSQNLQNIIPFMSLFITVVVILLMAHEYRYNTIMHTLTLSNSRSKVLASKVLAGSVYTVVMTVLVIATTFVGTHLAVDIKGLNLPPQTIDWAATAGRLAVYTFGSAMLGLAFIVLLRNLVASIVAIFILPMLETLTTAMLSGHKVQIANFLPYSALDRVVNMEGVTKTLSVSRAVLVVAVYLIGVWAVAWYLFLKRDAN